MNRGSKRFASHQLAAVASAVLGMLAVVANAAPPSPAVARIEFNRDIRPILSSKCFSCHGPDAGHRKADLRLDLADAAREAGAITPGKPGESSLVARITATNALVMPPVAFGKQLSAREIDLLRKWVAQGAEYQAHWSYLPPRRPQIPEVRGKLRIRNPIDRFILARAEAVGLPPTPEADPATLIRRVTFDLTGLPPTLAEVDAFVGETATERNARSLSRWSPNTAAYERVVDRLLASPRFGERMASYWLDLVRYADTVGYHGDQEHHISPYRDWVIKAFNDDLPFDQFTLHQLAGDLLPEPTENSRIASGYNRLLQTTHEGGAQDKEYLAKYSADRVRNLGGVWMGATTGCVECHDHKYDPYTQRDFYSFAAFFADVEERGAFKGPDGNPTLRPPELEVLSPLDRDEADRLQAQIERIREGAGGPAAGAEIAQLEQRRADLLKRVRPTLITVSVPPRPIRVLHRGDWMDETGAVVPPAFPHFLTPNEGGGKPNPRLTRLDLARWLTSPEHPQTSRVFVNRMWYLLFGAGLCRSLDDMGNQGEPPSHPELLDWLAATFMSTGQRDNGLMGTQPKVTPMNPLSLSPFDPYGCNWSMKRLLRLIVTSAAYRQSSVPSAEALRRDPDNRLFARQGRFRLPAEMVRDNALAASGLLVERLGGPSARPYQPEGYYALLNFPKRTYRHDANDNQYRRGVYVHWQRQYLHPMLRAFDAPSREECTAQRPNTNTPLAALVLLNDPTFVEAARVLAARILKEGGTDDASRNRYAWRLVLSRAPNAREAAALLRERKAAATDYARNPEAAAQLLKAGMAPVPPGVDATELAAWTAVARTLLNLSEAVTRN